MKLNFSLYRYNPDVDQKPYMKEYTLEVEEGSDMMLLDALIPVSYTHLTLPTIYSV